MTDIRGMQSTFSFYIVKRNCQVENKEDPRQKTSRHWQYQARRPAIDPEKRFRMDYNARSKDSDAKAAQTDDLTRSRQHYKLEDPDSVGAPYQQANLTHE